MSLFGSPPRSLSQPPNSPSEPVTDSADPPGSLQRNESNSLFGSLPRSQAPNFMLNEFPIELVSDSPDSPGSSQRKESIDEAENTQDHAPELVGPGFVGDSLDGPFYGSFQRPYTKCLDTSTDRYPRHDRFGAPPNPNNTPASYSEQASNAPSETGSCRARSPQASVSKPENLGFGSFSPSQSVFGGYGGKDDGNARRGSLRVKSSSGSFNKQTPIVLSPQSGILGYSPDDLNDTTPPLLRSSQFSPPLSHFGSSPIHLRGEESDSLDRKIPESPSTKRRKLSAIRPRDPRRHRVRRAFPYRVPTKAFHVPAEHTDRFPIPFPTIRNLPYRRGNQVRRELFKPIDPSRGMRKIKNVVMAAPSWKWLREFAMIRLSLHKSLPSDPHSTSYLVYLRVSRNTFSVKLSHTTKSDKRTLRSPTPASPAAAEGTMVLFQVSFFVPVALLSVGRLTVSVSKMLLGLGAVRGLVSQVLGVVMGLVEWVALVFLRVLGLNERVWLEVR